MNVIDEKAAAKLDRAEREAWHDQLESAVLDGDLATLQRLPMRPWCTAGDASRRLEGIKIVLAKRFAAEVTRTPIAAWRKAVQPPALVAN